MRFLRETTLPIALMLALGFSNSLYAQSDASPQSTAPVIADFEPAFVVYSVQTGPDWTLGAAVRNAAREMSRIQNAGPLFARRHHHGVTHVGFFTPNVTIAPDGFTVKRWGAYRAVVKQVEGPFGRMSQELVQVQDWVVSNGHTLSGDLVEVYMRRPDGSSVVELRLLLATPDDGVAESTAEADLPNEPTIVVAEEPEIPLPPASQPVAPPREPEALATFAKPKETPKATPTVKPRVANEDKASLRDHIGRGAFTHAAMHVLPERIVQSESDAKWLERIHDRIRVINVLVEPSPGDQPTPVVGFLTAVSDRCEMLLTTQSTGPGTTSTNEIQRKIVLKDLDRLIVNIHMHKPEPASLLDKVIELFERIATINTSAGHRAKLPANSQDSPQ